jgi:cellulose synthase/poly-beta-1,6-N-acetylglucosamine synthase-like glycosyltransferase
VRNGARWIESKLDSLLGSEYPPEMIRILVVSDGSTDATNDLVARYSDARVNLIALPPGGKATAVNRGIELASGEIIVLTDVRQQFDREALSHLVSCFADPEVGVVTGELLIREGLSKEEFNTGLYWRYEKWIRKNLNRIDAMLGATGSIYAIRRELAAPMPPNTLLDDVYVPFSVVSKGYRIYFDDQARAYDLPTSLHSEFWRKVRTQAGVYQITFSFPNLLWPGNPRCIHWVSHKIGRLLLPFALITIAVTSFSLPEPFRRMAIGGQAVFYCLAACDRFVGETNPLKRVTGVLRTFVVLVAAALCALAVFALPAQRLWKETRVNSPRHVPNRDEVVR